MDRETVVGAAGCLFALGGGERSALATMLVRIAAAAS